MGGFGSRCGAGAGAGAGGLSRTAAHPCGWLWEWGLE